MKETEPTHQEPERQQEHERRECKIESRDDQLPCCPASRLAIHKRGVPGCGDGCCSQYFAIAWIPILGKHGNSNNHAANDNEFQERVKTVHFMEYFAGVY